jgi:hypothetical protein
MKTKHSLTSIAFALLLLLITFVSSGQTIEGEWSGIVKVPGMDLRMNLYISRDGQAYTSTYDSPDQGTFGKQSTKTTFSFPDFSFSNQLSNFEVRGKVDSTYQSIRGQMFQRDKVYSVDLQRKPAAPPAGSTADLTDK